VNPAYVPAANNLALLLSESNLSQREALRLASVALKGAPDDPQIKDTAGWVLFNAGQYNDAFKLLQESAKRIPSSPIIQFHLGMAAQKVGDTITAKAALGKALASPSNFRGKEDARKAFALLQ
jgi:predicted Zn-dependent protease